MLRRCVLLLLLLNLLWLVLPAAAQSCDELSSASAYATQGDEFQADGLIAEAIDSYTCAIELEPENLDYINSRGILYSDAGEYDNAIADYEYIMELDPTYPYAWNNRGVVYYQRGDIEAALQDYTMAIDLDSEPAISLRNRSLIFYETGDYQSATEDLLSSIASDPQYKDAYLTLAWVYTISDSTEEAHPIFAEWINLNETDSRDITLSASVENEVYDMTQGMVYRLSFAGSAGQKINISARANATQDADPLLVLLDADGVAIASDDDSGINLDAVISNFELPADGDYTLLLSHAGAGATGEIRVSIDLGIEGEVAIANSFATYNLFVGELAEVYTTSGDRLNLRSGPGLDFEILSKLEAGTLVTLIEGPRKNDNYAWWRIRDDAGNEGWAVERVEEEQTLQLALLVGDDAIITTGGDMLNVRSGAGTDNDLAFQLEEGTRVTLLDAPQIVNGFRWWNIRAADGQEGWTIDRFEGDRMLIPARELD